MNDISSLLPDGDEVLPVQQVRPVVPKPPIVRTQECALCEQEKPSTEVVGISRCCCYADEICMECINTKSLLEYFRKCVTSDPSQE